MSSNLNAPRDPWSRLAAAARQARDDRDDAVPYGFSTRVAALAFAQPMLAASLFDRFALRALGIACLVALSSIALNYKALTATAPRAPVVASASANTVVLPTDDAVAIVLDLAD